MPTAPKKTSTPKPLASSASRPAAAASPTGGTQGFDIARPFRFTKGLVDGSFSGLFSGIAGGAHRGMWLGFGAAVLLALATGGGIGVLVAGWAIGLIAGGAMGGIVGGISGGVHGVAREQRRDKYAADLIARAKAKAQPAPAVDYRQAYHAEKRTSDWYYDRQQQQFNEINQQTRNASHWVDHVAGSRGPHNHTRGA